MAWEFPKGMGVLFCLGVFHEVALGWQLELEKKGTAAARSLLGLSCTMLGFVSVISSWTICTSSKHGSLRALHKCSSEQDNIFISFCDLASEVTYHHFLCSHKFSQSQEERHRQTLLPPSQQSWGYVLKLYPKLRHILIYKKPGS